MTLKKLRLTLLIALTVLGAAILFSWKLDFVASPLRSALENLTGSEVSFDRVEYRLFNRVTIQRLSVGSSFRCEAVTIYVNPWKLLRSLHNPDRALFRIHFTRPDITATPELSSIVRKLTSRKSPPSIDDLKISWESARVIWNTHTVERINGQALIGRDISLRLSGFLNDNDRLSLAYSSGRSGDGRRENGSLKLKGPALDGALSYSGTITPRGARCGAVSIAGFRSGDFTLQSATGSFTSASDGFLTELAGPSFSLRAGGNDERWSLTAGADISKMLPDSSGALTLAVSNNGDILTGSLHSEAVVLRSRQLGRLGFSFKKKAGGVLSGGGNLLPAGYTFALSENAAGEFTLSFQSPGDGSGSLSGAVSPLNLSLKFSAWPLERFPLLPPSLAPLAGNIDAEGVIRGSGADIALSGSNIHAENGIPQTLKAHVYSNAGNWFIRANGGNAAWSLNADVLKDGKWELSSDFKDFGTGSLLQFLTSPPTFDAVITGSARLTSNRAGSLALTARDLRFGGMIIGSGTIDASFDRSSIALKKVIIRNGEGTVSARGSLGLDAMPDRSRLTVSFQRYPSPAGLLHGSLSISGTLTPDKEELFSGTVDGEKIRVGAWYFSACRIPLTLTKHFVESPDFRLAGMLKGSARYSFTGQAIAANLTFNGIPAQRFNRRLSGTMSGHANVRGTIKNPMVDLSYVMPDSRYESYTFAHEAHVLYRDRTLIAEEIRVSSSTVRAVAHGRLWPVMDVAGEIEHLSLPAASGMLGITGDFSGGFSGALRVTGPAADPAAALQLSGKNVGINGLVFSDITAASRYSSGKITIDSASMRFNDSEIRLLKDSSVQLPARSFNLKTEWRNVHAGPADIFGSTVTLAGQWQNTGGSPRITGVLTASRLWVNQHTIDRVQQHFSLQDRKLSFQPEKDSKPYIAGSIDCSSLPAIRFSTLTVKDGQRDIILDGSLSPADLNLTLTAHAADAAAAATLLDLPVSLDGSVDATIIARGAAKTPHIEGSLNVANGSVAEIPFDNANIQFSVRNQVLTLTRARLFKKDQLTIVAAGYAPVFFDAEGRMKASSQPLDITLSIEQGSLGLLSALTDDIASGSGALNAQVRLSGTLGKPVTNGYLKVSDGQITARRYVSRLTGISLDCVLKNSKLTLNDFSARAGGGHVRGRGTVAFDGFAPESFDVVIFTDDHKGKGIPVSLPELPIPSPLFKSDELKLFSNLSHGEPTFYIHFSGPAVSPLLSGWITLESTHFTYPSVAEGGDDVTDSPLYPLYSKINWDLDIRAGKNTWYDNELVGVNIMGGIKLSGKGLSPTVAGKIEAVRGNISYMGTNFTIKRAQLEIIKDTVYLDGEGYTETTVKGYGNNPDTADTIQMIIDRAEITKIKPRFVSKANPSLSPEKALARATNTDPEMFARADQEFLLRQQLIRLVDSTLATPLAKSLLIRSGMIDAFRVEYSPSQQPVKPVNPASPTFTEMIAGTKYTMEKFITDQVLVGYSLTFDNIENRLDLKHDLELAYRLQKNLFLRATYGIESQENTRPRDNRIMIEKNFRFSFSSKKQ